VDAVLLALSSACLFGLMTVSLRFALARVPDAEIGAVLTIGPAAAVTLPFAIAQGLELRAVWPFLLAGVLGPGLSQLFFTLAVREAGPSRTSVIVGTAPLFSVVIAVALLGEPVEVALVAGALLIVGGGVLLVSERARPTHVRTLGLVFALGSTLVFAVRDNLVRWLSGDTNVPPGLAAAATLVAGGVAISAYLVATRRGAVRPTRAALVAYLPAGIMFGLSYVCLFEAYYRGRVTVVSPLVATESLWGVTASALLLRRTELVGARLFAGAALVVAGGALIGVFR
jgi:drug/metabolite transporter (DMT)-like permease